MRNEEHVWRDVRLINLADEKANQADRKVRRDYGKVRQDDGCHRREQRDTNIVRSVKSSSEQSKEVSTEGEK